MVLSKRGSLIADSTILKVVAASLVALLFAAVWFKNITGSPIERDAAENLQLAINLQHHHVYSADAQAPYHPSIVREPVPVMTMALSVALVDAVLGPAEPAAYFHGARARDIKLQNIVWMALLCLTVFYAIYGLSSSFYLALLGVILINKVPLVTSGLVYAQLLIDTLYTEIPAATLLLLGSTLLVQGTKQKRMTLIATAGVCFGALALTKAAFLYVFIGTMALWVGTAVFNHFRKADGLLGLRQLLVVGLAFLMVVLPWLARNYVQVGTFQIAGRGGIALHQRAVNDEMTNDELRATLYWWAPDPVSRWIFGRALGLSPKDFLHRDSPFRRLSRDEGSDFYESDFAAFRAGRPEAAISFYFKSFAEERQLLHRLEAAGVPNADLVVDKTFEHRAFTIMEAHPLRQLVMSPLFMYRAAAYLFIALMAVLAYALRARRNDLLIFIAPSLALLAFYALFTDYIIRYAAMVIPLAIAAVAAVLATRLKPRSNTYFATPAL
jgi:hypothetical protein